MGQLRVTTGSSQIVSLVDITVREMEMVRSMVMVAVVLV